ncbi:hypothetical protein [Nocardioides acrostichi]|uniref:DUF4267 domain-containing protein n=1 Tax=Nocardioides acrostichi TaxID=2784339 RepID=A0A930V3P8_9ACTN|nr:hypothetical protein [Nocardioides acrostichi]MBF4163140.1 hypothetical protein [Nocardioides acrostichi]
MNPVTGLSLGRIAVGAACIARPDLASTYLGVATSTNPQAGFVTRLFGTREIAIGAATLLASGKGRAGLVLIGVGVDAADAWTGFVAPAEQGLEKRAGTTMAAAGTGAAVMGLLGLLPSQRTTLTRAERKAAKKAANEAARESVRKA